MERAKLTEIVREIWNSQRQICRWFTLPLLGHCLALTTYELEARREREIEPRGTDEGIYLNNLARC